MANLNTTENRETEMTRTITAQQIKPGMKIKYEQLGWERIAKVAKAYEVDSADAPREDCVVVWSETKFGHRGTFEVLNKSGVVEVLEEAQPDEPKEPGSLVVVEGGQFIRCDHGGLGWRMVDTGDWYYWDDLCAIGQIVVAEANPAWPEGVA